MQQTLTKSGNLVWVKPGNYLAEQALSSTHPAFFLVPEDILGTVIDDLQDRKLVQLNDVNNSRIYVKDNACKNA